MSSELPDAVELREAQVARARALFRRAFLYDLLVAAVYLPVFPFIALPYSFISLIRVLAFRSQFRAHVGGIAGFARPLLTGWLVIGNPEWRFYVAAIAIGVATIPNLLDWPYPWYDGFLVLVPPAFHVAVAVRLMATAQKDANLKLVVLRVFGIDETAQFTFEGLLTYWRHFGSFFTVVDPSFLKSQQRQRNRLIPLLMVTFFLLAILSEEVPAFKEAPVYFLKTVLLPAFLILGALYVYGSLRLAERGFVRSREDLLERLQRLDARPRNLNLTFKSLPLMCFDNTWRIAVSECVKGADAVLMDLRGFSEENKGCQYEVDFLLDVITVDRIVFLVEPSAVAGVKELILERWEMLRTTSPNLEAERPHARIYVTSKENARDIQGILDDLLVAAHSSAAR